MMTGYKTLIVSSAIAMLGAAQALDWARLIPDNPQASGYVVMGIGIVMGILRTMTNTTVMKSTSPAPTPENKP